MHDDPGVDGRDDCVGTSPHVSLTTRDDGPGVVVIDHVERHRFELWTDGPVTPEPTDGERFRFPTDAAVAVRTAAVTVPTVVQTYVRDADGRMLAEVDRGTDVSFGPGSYDIEVCAPMKIYLRIEGPLEVSADVFGITIAADVDRRVLVGGRSHHERPAATVTTTAAPRDVLRALSTFGSALKTTSTERSYPTLRGHPPLVELGETLDVPDGLEPPDTGIEIVLPPELGPAYVAAPLAYYLGATMVPGDTPRLVTETGVDEALGPDVERTVRETLERTFLLDCLVRTEGYYRVDLHERRVAERRIDLDFSSLYDRSPADRLAAYLDVPYDVVADLVPDWGLTTHVSPTPAHVEVLPFLAHDLAVVRTPADDSATATSPQAEATAAFFRAGDSPGGEATAGGFTRGTAARGATNPDVTYIQPEPTDALEQVWVGDGTPLGATKAIPEAYHNRLGRSPVEGDIDITVVCNDRAMAAESDVVDETYGTAVNLPFDVSVREELTRAELRETLARDGDFLHYIGHIDDRGFECADGWLHAETVDHVGTDAFLLNACQSFEQGTELVRAGAVAGIVTLNDVVNDVAVRMGHLLARLLNHGFPMTGALDVAADAHPIDDQYTVVGDGRLTLARTEGSAPNAPVVATIDGDDYELTYCPYPTNRTTTGSMIRPYVGDDDEHYLFSGTVGSFDVSPTELAEFLALEPVPVRIDGEVRWSDEMDLDEL
ncbi:MAG: hypothetical protein ABEJ81_07090 [Haloferacaceae archaeon]